MLKKALNYALSQKEKINSNCFQSKVCFGLRGGGYLYIYLFSLFLAREGNTIKSNIL